MTDIAGLRKRVEAASGSSRELDARIQHALFPDQRVMLDHGNVGPGPKRPARYGEMREINIDGWSDWEGIAMHIGAAAYTASLDASLALVEKVKPGLQWGVSTFPEDELFNPGGVQAFISDCKEDGIYFHGEAQTAPLAILSVLLATLEASDV